MESLTNTVAASLTQQLKEKDDEIKCLKGLLANQNNTNNDRTCHPPPQQEQQLLLDS